MLDREEAPGAPEAGLHLVDDEHDPGVVAEPPQAGHELLRRDDEAALALHRLDDDRRDVLGRDLRQQRALERRERLGRGDGRGSRTGRGRGRPPATWLELSRRRVSDGSGGRRASWTGAEPADGWLFGRHDPVEQWKGWVTAFDPESGDVKWKIQTPKPMVAAITATAGGLVFTGDLDGQVLAYDAATARNCGGTPPGRPSAAA